MKICVIQPHYSFDEKDIAQCFEELLAPYIEKPQGKPTLVPESDKRPAMNTAKNDFMEEF